MARAEISSDFPDGTRIAGQDCVGSEKNKSFHNRLRDENAVERISMDRRQVDHSNAMSAGDGKFVEVVLQKLSAESPRVLVEIAATKTLLD